MGFEVVEDLSGEAITERYFITVPTIYAIHRQHVCYICV